MTVTEFSSLIRQLHNSPPDNRRAFLFPGQGSQHVGMGKELARAFPFARELFSAAGDILQMDFATLCFGGPEEELTRTSNTQPAVFVTSLASLAAAVESGSLAHRPAFVAGHSLGEYAALVAGGSLTFEDGVALVHERGRLMEAAGVERPGTLAALLGLDAAAAEDICRLSGAELCNYNGPTQVVIGGTHDAIDRAGVIAKERGGRALPVNVSGAFHTSLMAQAATRFAEVVERFEIADAVIPTISNVTARPLQNPADVRSDVTAQIKSPVRWYQSIDTMVAAGVRKFIELAPGRVLTNQLKRSHPDVTAVALDGNEAPAGARNV